MIDHVVQWTAGWNKSDFYDLNYLFWVYLVFESHRGAHVDSQKSTQISDRENFKFLRLKTAWIYFRPHGPT